jgi:hypothetical protein
LQVCIDIVANDPTLKSIIQDLKSTFASPKSDAAANLKKDAGNRAFAKKEYAIAWQNYTEVRFDPTYSSHIH